MIHGAPAQMAKIKRTGNSKCHNVEKLELSETAERSREQ